MQQHIIVNIIIIIIIVIHIMYVIESDCKHLIPPIQYMIIFVVVNHDKNKRFGDVKRWRLYCDSSLRAMDCKPGIIILLWLILFTHYSSAVSLPHLLHDNYCIIIIIILL